MAKNRTGLKNREFLQLCQTYDSKKHGIGGWYCSEKLDGMRAIWDGGLTTGMSVYEVPFANVERETDNRGEGTGNERICTGLWSRYGKVIHAPTWWLQQLPNYPLDGELWIRNGGFQELIGATKKLIPVDSEWQSIRFMIFDAPSYQQLFAEGRVNGVNYVQSFDNAIWEWVVNQVNDSRKNMNDLLKYGLGRTFNTTYSFLKREIKSNDFMTMVVHQEVLPIFTHKAVERVEELLEQVTDMGGEGLVLRDPNSCWMGKRNEWCLKVKKLHDMEGVVMGYKAGLGKLEGLIGSVTIRIVIEGIGERQFDLSGFTDQERELVTVDGSKLEVVPGASVSENVTSSRFPRGSKITFRYRELTNDGLPREARYLRRIGS